jgi:hypothetical protein
MFGRMIKGEGCRICGVVYFKIVSLYLPEGAERNQAEGSDMDFSKTEQELYINCNTSELCPRVGLQVWYL